MFATNLEREPLPNAVLRANQRSTERANTVSNKPWMIGTINPPLYIKPRILPSFTAAVGSLLTKLSGLPNTNLKIHTAIMKHTTITQNAALIP